MKTPQTGRRGLARIIVASLAIGTFILPMTAGVAAAAPATTAGAALPAQQQQPPADDGSSGSNSDPDPDPDTGGSGSDPDDGNGGSGSDPDGSNNDGGNDGGNNGGGANNGGANNGGANNGGANNGGRPSVTDPRAEQRRQEEEKRRKEEEKRRKEEAEAAQKAEEKRQKEILRQQREAAERREKEAKAVQNWVKKGRPRQMVTVRTDRLDVVDGGSASLKPRRPGALSLKELGSLLPADFVSIDGDTATISTTIVLTPGTALEIADIPNVRLTGGPEATDASSIYTGGGKLTVEGTTITGVDRESGQPLPFDAAGRPIIEAASDGTMDIIDATITDMGVPELGEEGARPAVSFNPDSTGSVVRTTLQRNNIGVELSKSENVALDAVTVTESEGDGIVLNADQGTRMGNLRAENNGGNGMYVSGRTDEGVTTDRPVTGLTTLGNKLYGLVVAEQEGIQISAVDTEGDEAGGLRLNQAVDVTVTDYTATDQPIGIFTHVGSTGIVLDGIHASGGRRGVVVEKSTTNLEMRNSTVEGSRVAGVNIGGKEIRVNGVEVSNAKSAVRLERGSGHIDLTGVKVYGGRDGVVTSAGASDVTISDLEANQVEDDAIRTATPGITINGGTINGGTTGIDVTAAATITAVAINGSTEGLHARSEEMVHAENIAIDATELGLNVSDGTPFMLANSSVHALEAVRGEFLTEGVNDIGLPPLNLLAAMGVPLILLAIVLEQVHSFRQRRVGGNRRHAPPAIPVGAN